jgi:hypothetical protein
MWLQKEAEWKGTAGTTIGTSLKVGSTLNPKP